MVAPAAPWLRAAALLVLMACASQPGSIDDGGVAPDGPLSLPAQRCPDYCLAVTGAGCPGDRDDCFAACARDFQQVLWRCQRSWADYLRCLATRPAVDFVCAASSGRAVPRQGVCLEAQQAYVQCQAP